MTDLPGLAIKDFYQKKTKHKLYVHDNFGPRVPMPLSLYFRTLDKMPLMEQQALKLCKGNILDIGAGAGAHALVLQDWKKDVTALEISPASCEVMLERNVTQVVCMDVFAYQPVQPIDTLLLLMNGIGLCGDLQGLSRFLDKASTIIAPGGQLLFDSCDVSYMYEDEDKPTDYYYGEVTCRYEYQNAFTEWFKWLYIDSNTLTAVAQSKGWTTSIVQKDENDQYLAVLKRI